MKKLFVCMLFLFISAIEISALERENFEKFCSQNGHYIVAYHWGFGSALARDENDTLYLYHYKPSNYKPSNEIIEVYKQSSSISKETVAKLIENAYWADRLINEDGYMAYAILYIIDGYSYYVRDDDGTWYTASYWKKINVILDDL